MDDSAPSQPVQKSPLVLRIVGGLTTLGCSILTVVLMALFWKGHDVVWGTCLLTFTIIPTLFNLALVCATHEGKRSPITTALLALLQLKASVDTFSSPSSDSTKPRTHNRLLREGRALRFIHSVVQSLPVSFVLTYVSMLNLQGRDLNHTLIYTTLGCSLLSFSLGTTRFTAGSDTTTMNIVVLIHVLSQFVLRILAVCVVCVRFEHWGMLASLVSWFVVFVCGPQGTFLLLCGRFVRAVGSGELAHHHQKQSGSCCAVLLHLLLKVVLTAVSFFIVLRAEYQSPVHKDQPVLAHHCFGNFFLLVRVLENLAMVACFLFLPPNTSIRPPTGYHSLLQNKTVVLSTTGGLCFLVLVTWVVLRRVRDSRNRAPVNPNNAGYIPQADHVGVVEDGLDSPVADVST